MKTMAYCNISVVTFVNAERIASMHCNIARDTYNYFHYLTWIGKFEKSEASMTYLDHIS